MKKLILITGDKGGVGKSFVTRTVADLLLTEKIEFRAFDTDKTNATFYRFYPQYVECLNVAQPQDLDRLLTELSESESPFLVDCAARTLESILVWAQGIDFFNLKKDLGIEMTLVFVLGPEKDCVQILRDIVKQFGNHVRYIIVKNLSRGKSFEIYEQSSLKKTLLDEFHAQEIELPALLEKTALQVDQGNLTWSDAVSHSSLQIADRQRVKIYRNKMNEIFKERLAL